MNSLYWKIGLLVLFIALISFISIRVDRSFRSDPEIVNPGTHIDSTAVITLQHKIKELQNELNAKPKIIYVPFADTTGMGYPVYTEKEVKVYPVGSFKTDDRVKFKVKKDLDSLGLNVNITSYDYLYVDKTTGKLYHSDSLDVWLTDINIYKAYEKQKPHKPKFLSVIAGVNPQFEYNAENTPKIDFKSMNLDFGIRLLDKLDVSATASTDLLYGIRIGWRL